MEGFTQINSFYREISMDDGFLKNKIVWKKRKRMETILKALFRGEELKSFSILSNEWIQKTVQVYVYSQSDSYSGFRMR